MKMKKNRSLGGIIWHGGTGALGEDMRIVSGIKEFDTEKSSGDTEE
jgi:hypothetical protein